MPEPTMEQFREFYDKYEEASRKKDEKFLLEILPPDVPADEVAFVLDMSQQVSLAIEASGVKPQISQTGNRFDVSYEGDLGDDMTSLTMDFYFHDGRWLKYDPEG